MNISIKEMEFDGNDMIPSGDYSLRISVENLKLRDDCQREKHIRGSYPVSFREQSSQLEDRKLNQAKTVFETVRSTCS